MANVTKIYELRTLGYDQTIKQLGDIEKQFKDINAAKKDLVKQKSTTREESDAMKSINAELEAQRIKTKALLVEKQKLVNEAKAEQLVRQSQINQEKQAAAAAKTTTQAVIAEANSYNSLYRQQKELYALIKNADPRSTRQNIQFNGQNLNFSEAIKEYERLSAAEQEFRRQFARDKTLVGEYTSGIIQAFKKMGLEDLVGAQATKAAAKVNDLNKEFEELKTELTLLKATGGAGLDKLEQELIANRVEAGRFEKEVERLNRELATTGDVGNQVTQGLKKGFGEIKGQMSQFLLGYVGLQAALSGGRQILDVNFGFEDTTNQLRAITGVAGAQLEFLKDKALETSASTKFSAQEILESFKLIASAKPELLQNVEALNQVKDAAVILAQASGQTLPEAVGNLTAVLNQFNAGAGDSAVFIDALAAGAKFGAAEIPNITTALLDFGTQAKSSNVSIFESVGLIELLAEKGIQGGEAGTKLRNVLLSLSATDALPKKAVDALAAAGVNMAKLGDESLTLEERLKELSKVQGDNAAILQIFGKENFNAAQIVLKNVPRYAQLTEQIKSLGVAQEQAAATTESASVRWAIFTNQLKNLVTSKNVTAFLSGLAGVLSFLIGNLQLTIPLILITIGLTNTWAGTMLRLTAAYTLQGTAWVLERTQIILNNAVKVTGIAVTNLMTAATLRAAAATGLAAVGYRALTLAIAFLTGPIGLAVGLIVALTTVFGIMSARAESTSKNILGVARSQARLNAESKITTEVSKRVSEATSDQIGRIRTLTQVTTAQTSSEDTRRKALEELIKISPRYREAITAEGIALDKVRAISDDLISSIQRQAKVKAFADLNAEKEKKKFELETAIALAGPDEGPGKSVLGLNTQNFTKDLLSRFGLGKGTTGQQLRDLKVQLGDVTEELKVIGDLAGTNTDLQNAIIAGVDAAAPAGTAGESTNVQALKKHVADVDKEIKTLVAIKNKNTEQQARLKLLRRDRLETLRQIRELSRGEETDTNTPRGSRVDLQVSERFKEIEAVRKLEQAAEETRLAELKRAHRLTLDEEETHIENMRRISVTALTQKIAQLSAQRFLNAEEKLTLAELKKELAEVELKAQEQNEAVRLRRFEAEKNRLAEELEERIRIIKQQDQRIQDDPTIGSADKAQAKLETDRKILDLQLQFAATISALEVKQGVQSIENVKKAGAALRTEIAKQKEEIISDSGKLTQAGLDQQKEAGERQLAEFRAQIAAQRLAVAKSDKSPQVKSVLDKEIDDQERIGFLAREVGSMQAQLPIYKKLLEEKKITSTEYFNFIAALEEKEAELQGRLSGDLDAAGEKITDIGGLIRSKLQGLFNFDLGTAKGRGQAELFAQTVTQTYAFAEQAMNNYFDRKQQRIQQEQEFELERLTIEFENRKKGAQGQAEQASLDKQFAQEKENLEKQAFEKNKKMQLAQAKVNLAIQLANLAVVASAPGPLNILTLGTAGIIMYAIQAALAIAAYGINTANIRGAKFEQGGQIDTSTTRGGQVGGRSHEQGGNPFVFKGRVFEDEVDELNIIRTKSAPKNKVYEVVGTQAQIASKMNEIGGGVRFAPGAKLKRFALGGRIGESLQAPTTPIGQRFGGTITASQDQRENMALLVSRIEYLAAEQSARVDRLQVYQETGSVTKAQKKLVQQNDIASF